MAYPGMTPTTNSRTVTLTTASTSVLAANPKRAYLYVVNISTINAWLDLSASAAITKSIPLKAADANGFGGGTLEQWTPHIYQGAITAMSTSTSASGSINVIEGI